jgi:hypothetical protein
MKLLTVFTILNSLDDARLLFKSLLSTSNNIVLYDFSSALSIDFFLSEVA